VLQEKGMLPDFTTNNSTPNPVDAETTEDTTGNNDTSLPETMTDEDAGLQQETPLEQPNEEIPLDNPEETQTENETTTDIAPQEENPIATKSLEELKSITKTLESRAKKLAIIAATKQNLSAKMSAASIQSAAEKLLQELENDGNIDTLGKKEQELTTLIQRFISLAKTLNGSSQ
jgi:hypothetical protein